MYTPLHEANGDSLDKVFSIAAGVINTKTGSVRSGNANSYSSIAKMASKLVAIFPVLCSRTVSSTTARMVTKYIEQMSCHFLMLGLQQANIDSARSGIEYLRKFHQNLGDSNDLDTTISAISSWIDAYEAGKGYSEGSLIMSMRDTDIDLDAIFECDRDLDINVRDMKALMEIMRNNENIKVYDTQLNPRSIDDYMINESYGTYHVSIKPLSEANNTKQISFGLNKAAGNSFQVLRQDWLIDHNLDPRIAYYDKSHPAYTQALKWQQEDDAVEEQERRKEKERREDEAYQNKKDDRDYELQKRRQAEDDREYTLSQRRQAEDDRQYNLDKRQREEDELRAKILSKLQSGANVGILKDQDIKKMNDAVPSILDVKFYNSSNSSVETHFIIGVKAKLLPVTTSEILRRIVNNNKDSNGFGKFMRVITGELKASEAILGISRIKDDLTSSKKKGAYGDTWNLLQNRARAARAQVKRGQQNDFSAITTVVISQADADELYREENLDITSPKVAKRFMESYNIMAFAIVDDAVESMKIMFDDGNKFFSEIAYKMLERETENGEYKKLINLMSAASK